MQDATPVVSPSPSSTLRLSVEGMSCGSCAAGIENALRNTHGVHSASVNFAVEAAVIDFDPTATSSQQLAAVIEGRGYRVPVPPNASSEPTGEKAASQPRAPSDPVSQGREGLLLLFCALLTLPLLAPMLGLGLSLSGQTQLLLAAPVQVLGGARFYQGAWDALRRRQANMDVLVALGTSAAFLLSLATFEVGGPMYFEGAAAIITFVRLGKWLEARARRNATEAIRSLMSLRPETARVRREGEEITLPADGVKPHDEVIVRPGEYVPVDGEIIEGASTLDESVITGEAAVVDRGVGDLVRQGSVNGNGWIAVRATRRAAESTLERMVELVRSAQASKAPIQRLVDRVSAIFVPVVLAIAVITFFGWWMWDGQATAALIHAVSVLVIACPCALGLATPAALAVGTGAAARAGILFKDAEAIERCSTAEVVVFDKTGTLTEGKPRVVAVDAPDPKALLALAAAAQYGSEHPLGEAVRSAAQERGIECPKAEAFEALPGRGVRARVNGAQVVVGSPRWVDELCTGSDRVSHAAREQEAQGRTVLWVGVDGQLLGAISVGDRVRESSRTTIQRLQQSGIQTTMLTGDSQTVATRVAETLGIAHVRAEVLPEEKVREVQRLRAAGQRVMMVGDGVNDAPALAEADVSVAMGSGSDVAMHAAGVTLMRPDLALIPAVLDVCRATRRKIAQNLFWAFAFNTLGIPLAAFGLLSPMVASLAMASSSVAVLSNALLLRSWQPRS